MDLAEKLQHIKALQSMDADEWRFWQKVAIAGDTECWLWTSAHVHGRAVYALNNTSVPAARYMWSLIAGAMPSKHTIIRHICDNPLCVNPAHLVAGTHADNMADMVARGRQITMPHVDKDIKELALQEYLAGKGTQWDIAQQYGITARTLQRWLQQYRRMHS